MVHGKNHNHYTYRLACTDLLMASDDKPNIGQPDLVTRFIGHVHAAELSVNAQ